MAGLAQANPYAQGVITVPTVNTPQVNVVAISDGEGSIINRGNVDVPLITAVGATTTQDSTDQINYNARGVKIVLSVTTAGTGSVTLVIQGKDLTSGVYYTILTGAAVTTNVANVYTVYPGITAAANVSASDVLPKIWRVHVVANNANATSYTVSGSTII